MSTPPMPVVMAVVTVSESCNAAESAPRSAVVGEQQQ
jgi:hypothetical protein